ncbi:hypothetical protein JCM4914_20570 [Streptomyces platensis subsp. malvinus]
MGARNAPANHPRVAGENESSADLAMFPIVHRTTDNAARPGRRRAAPPTVHTPDAQVTGVRPGRRMET